MRLRAFRLSALKSLTGPLRRRLVGIPKSKEGGGKKLKQIGQMEWLPPSPNGIAMCQDCGVQSHKTERTAY
ncbi:MAG: hypothetical protein FD150_2082, partial [Rhodobacteraceae bacterium]